MALLDDLPFFSTTGRHVMGMSSNGLLSVTSIVVARSPRSLRGPVRTPAA